MGKEDKDQEKKDKKKDDKQDKGSQEKAKKSYLNKMGSVVKSHVKDVFTGIIKKGCDNAESLHEVKVQTQQKLDGILKNVYHKVKGDSGKLKLLASDVKETIQKAYKQAIAAALNEAEENAGEGEYGNIGEDFDLDSDDFMKEFDFGDDDGNYDDDDDNDSDDSDDDEDEESNESYMLKLALMRPKEKKPEVSNESYYSFSLESFDKATLAGSVILFLNKCILYYKSHINEIQLSDSYLDFLSWLETKINTEEARASLMNLLNTVDHGISVPEATPETAELVSETLNESIPPVYVKRVGLEDPETPEESIFNVTTADDETLRELVHIGTVAEDILSKLDADVQNDEASNAVTMIHSLLSDISKMYMIEHKVVESEGENNNILVDLLENMTKLGYPLLEKCILIDLSLVEDELVDTARQAIVLFSNIINK